MPRGMEQKYLSIDGNKQKLEFQISGWGVCKAIGSGACWKHIPAHVLGTCRTVLLTPGQRCRAGRGVPASPLGRENLQELPSPMDVRGGAGKEVL